MLKIFNAINASAYKSLNSIIYIGKVSCNDQRPSQLFSEMSTETSKPIKQIIRSLLSNPPRIRHYHYLIKNKQRSHSPSAYLPHDFYFFDRSAD